QLVTEVHKSASLNVGQVCSLKALASLEFRLALLEKCSDTLFLVLAREAQREQVDFGIKPRSQVQPRGVLDRLFGHRKRDRAHLGYLVGNLESLLLEILGSDYVIH